MERELVKTLLRAVLRNMLARVKANPKEEAQYQVDMQLGTLCNRVEQMAKQQVHIANGDSLSTQDQKVIVSTLWEMINCGILIPSQDDGHATWPFVSLTCYGQTAISEEEYSPYDPDGYLMQLQREVDDLDDVLIFYLTEALGCFRANQNVACMVMLGVASERLFDIMLESFITSLSSEREKDQLQKNTQGRMVVKRYDELRKRIDPKKGQFPPQLAENLDTYLVSIFNLVRYTRNDGGHPTGRAFRRDEAYANLYVFAQYCKYIYQLIGFLRQNQGSLN